MNEVNFWLGKIHLEGKDYFQGMKAFESVSDKNMEKDIIAVKTKTFRACYGHRNVEATERCVPER